MSLEDAVFKGPSIAPDKIKWGGEYATVSQMKIQSVKLQALINGVWKTVTPNVVQYCDWGTSPGGYKNPAGWKAVKIYVYYWDGGKGVTDGAAEGTPKWPWQGAERAKDGTSLYHATGVAFLGANWWGWHDFPNAYIHNVRDLGPEPGEGSIVCNIPGDLLYGGGWAGEVNGRVLVTKQTDNTTSYGYGTGQEEIGIRMPAASRTLTEEITAPTWYYVQSHTGIEPLPSIIKCPPISVGVTGSCGQVKFSTYGGSSPGQSSRISISKRSSPGITVWVNGTQIPNDGKRVDLYAGNTAGSGAWRKSDYILDLLIRGETVSTDTVNMTIDMVYP
ncbi:hypothetical protein O4K29_004494 [Salmonella enterica]|nr:hypothetical protein [Salmonella enterica]EKJ6041792.1 hypothetical protein [Salmonella enterica]